MRRVLSSPQTQKFFWEKSKKRINTILLCLILMISLANSNVITDYLIWGQGTVNTKTTPRTATNTVNPGIFIGSVSVINGNI